MGAGRRFDRLQPRLGVIDGTFYLLGAHFSRNRRLEFVRRLRAMPNEGEALAAIREEFQLGNESCPNKEEKLAVDRALLKMLRQAGTARRAHPPGREFVAAALIAALVVATAVPALAALLLLPDVQLALRVANIAETVLLFAVGYAGAHYTGTRRWLAGLMITVLPDADRRQARWMNISGLQRRFEGFEKLDGMPAMSRDAKRSV